MAATLILAQAALGVPAPAAGERMKPPEPPPVKVNRTIPKVDPPPAFPRFSATPADAEITRARVFEEPLVPIGGPTNAGENKALAGALMAYLGRHATDEVTPIISFLEAYRKSPWRPALLMNLGIVYFQSGHFSRALDAWDEAWRLSKAEPEPPARAVADRALAELANMNGRLGRLDTLEALLDETRSRDVGGSAGEKLRAARQGLWLMKNEPDKAFLCGPLALARVLAFLRPSEPPDPRVTAARSTRQGTSVLQVRDLARAAGLPMQIVRRAADGPPILPAVVHWKAGHFAALVREQSGRYLVQDPTFGSEVWISADALNDEASGYFLVREGTLPAGWMAVSDAEGAAVWGKGATGSDNQEQKKKCDTQVAGGGCGGPPPRMAQYSVHAMLVSLHIWDTPVGYTPPVGPPVEFEVTYGQRESFQPQTFSYSNFGPKWTADWISYITDDPLNPGNGRLYARGGGQETYSGFSTATQSTQPHMESRATLVLVTSTPIKYERRLPDGSVETFAQPDGAMASPRKIFLTQWTDPQGNSVSYTYDASLRLVDVKDALNQHTQLFYELPADGLKITKVRDPFGREATFEYDQGRLIRITDVIGIRSEFTYGAGDFITSMTTPYGATKFAATEDGRNRSLEITDPNGARERVEFRPGVREMPSAEDASVVPSGMGSLTNLYLNYRVTYFWDKRAMALHPGDYTKARQIHWLHEGDPNATTTSGIAESEKQPLENRVWYRYPGQWEGAPHTVGTDELPSKIGRVLDDGTTQLTQFEYNTAGKTIRAIDPAGRETRYTYGNNNTPDDPANPTAGAGIDLLKVEQKNGSAYDLLASYTYNTKHEPLTHTDASGKVTTLTYYANGQLHTVKNAKDETWTLTYDANGYLQRIDSPVTEAGVGMTWDGYGRVRTMTNMENYTVTVDYDLLDRPTKVTYPNGTYEQVVYDRLDPSKFRDLLGRWSQVFVDALRRPTGVRDAAGRTITLQWCDCGSLEKLIDANNHATRWERDDQGRVTREVRADATATSYTYENATSRLKRTTDARQQVRTYEYFIDDRLKSVAYSNAPIVTPGVSFTYDPVYGRLDTRTDGTGLTQYSYIPIDATATLGKGQLLSIDGPLANDLATYTYDELGRVKSRSINSVGVSVDYDSLSRVTNVNNALGSFIYDYDGNTTRLASVTGPSGLLRTYSYFNQAGDHQLQEITNKVGGTVISRFAYTYGADNKIATWTQQAGTGPAKRYELSYDSADQLTAAVLKDEASGSILKRYGYEYDKSFNRTSEQVDDLVTASAHNSVDEVTSRTGGGAVRFAGSTNESAKSVTIQGKPAVTTATNDFSGMATVTGGTNSVVVVAKDTSDNVRTNTYNVTVAGGASGTLTYDANGNLTSDGTKTYDWDAANRLVAINQGTLRTEFTYDGFGRRTRIVEKTSGSVTSDKRFLWVGTGMAEERDASGGTTAKRYFGQGVQQSGTNLLYAKDHLGSTRELLDGAGSVRARYDYDPYGRRTKSTGDLEADSGFTGFYTHAQTGVNLALYRGYDSTAGRWLKRDSVGIAGGINLYDYVRNDPINLVDPFGLSWGTFGAGLASGFGSGLIYGAIGGLILGAAAGTVLFPFLAAAAIGLAAFGLYQGAKAMWNACSEDQVAYIAGQMIGGTIGGAAGGGAGFRAGVAAKPTFPGARSSALPDYPFGFESQPTATTFVGEENGPPVAIEPGSTVAMAENGEGLIYEGPSGGNVRVMNPTTQNPTGYVRIQNAAGNYINPATGRPGPNSVTHCRFITR